MPDDGRIVRQCTKCMGCGRVANSDDGEPWTFWASLPPGSDLAVRLGIVAPIPCPTCGGTGTLAVSDPLRAAKGTRITVEDHIGQVPVAVETRTAIVLWEAPFGPCGVYICGLDSKAKELLAACYAVLSNSYRAAGFGAEQAAAMAAETWTEAARRGAEAPPPIAGSIFTHTATGQDGGQP